MIDDARTPAVPGIELAAEFYREHVAPLLRRDFPALACSAALIGPGSEILGYDDRTSTDHDWGPRVMLFLGDREAAESGQRIVRSLAHSLPRTYRGFPTSFTPADPADDGTRRLAPGGDGPVSHRVEVHELSRWLADYLGVRIDLRSPGLRPLEWLTIPQQKLLSLVAGAVFHDGLSGALTRLRAAVAWYPDDVWRYLIAAVWRRIGQEDHLVGRAGSRGDEVGARIIASRLVRDVMRLTFLLDRAYAPYAKWFGTAFAHLPSAAELAPALARVTEARDWESRDRALAQAYRVVLARFNSARLLAPVPEEPVRFFGRPFSVICLHGIAGRLLESISSPWLTPTMRRSPLGGIDFLTDNTDLLEDPAYGNGLRRMIAGG